MDSYRYKTTYSLDTNADTVIILRNLAGDFAVWDTHKAAYVTKRDQQTAESHDELITENSGDHSNAVDGGNGQETYTEHSVEESALAESLDETEPIIHYFVSSRHLSLASPVFRRMMHGEKWTQSVRNEKSGLFELDACDFNEDALLIVLQILHLQNSKVPQEVSLGMFVMIAVIVDYYDCTEALLPWIEKWYKNLKTTSPIPTYFCRELILWMCASWVFKLPDAFKLSTEIAMKRIDQEVPDLGLPIINCIYRIDKFRSDVIGTIISKLRIVMEEFANPDYICPKDDKLSFECGCFSYGSLARQLKIAGLFPFPEAPYLGLDIQQLCEKASQIKSPSWCSPDRYNVRKSHGCDLRARVMSIVDGVMESAGGLELENF